jgi:hypothetical protein
MVGNQGLCPDKLVGIQKQSFKGDVAMSGRYRQRGHSLVRQAFQGGLGEADRCFLLPGRYRILLTSKRCAKDEFWAEIPKGQEDADPI